MIQMRKARTWFAALLAFAAAPAIAQTGGIAGRVTDAETGTGVGTATVEVRQGGRLVSSVRSREDGSYTVVGLAAGSYDLQAKAIGYAAKSASGVPVTAGGTATANFALSQQATSLAATTVTASRRPEKALDAPAQISVIPTEQIETRPAVTVADHLRSTPGVDATQGGIAQTNIVARGFNNIFSGSMLMLQDYRFAGVPSLRVNVPFLFTGTNEDIERVEVLLGPASALFGPNSANGVLHVITKSPFDSKGTTVTLDGGTQSLFRGAVRTAQTLGTKAAIKVSGEMMRGSDFEYRDPGEPATIMRGGQPVASTRDFDVERYTGEARVDLRPMDNMELITTFGHTNIGSGIELTGANGAAQIRNWTYSNLQQRLRWGRFFAQGFVNLSNAGNESPQDTEGTFLLRSGQPIVDRSRVVSLQAQHGTSFGANYDFTYGLDYIRTTPRTGGTINGANEEVDEMTEVGGYVQGTAKLTPKFELLGALRLDSHSLIEGSFFSPRAALIFRPTQDQNLRLTYNRAFNTPQNFSFFLDLIARDLPIPGIDVYAAGNPPKTGWQFNRGCSAGIGSFCMRTPATGTTWVPAASPASAYTAVYAGLAPQLQAGLQAAGLPAAQAAAIVAYLNPTVPASPANGNRNPATVTPTQANLGAGRLTYIGSGQTLNPSQVVDIAPLKASFNETYELGWKGLLGQKFQFDAALWYSERADVGTTSAVATPSVTYDPTALAAYYQPRIQGLLQQSGVPADQAAGLATQLAAGLAGGVGSFPLGTVTFDHPTRAQNANILATYQTISGKTLHVGGLDLGLTYQLTPRVSLVGTYGYTTNLDSLGSTVFTQVIDSRGAPLTLNSPAHKASLTARWDNALGGWGGEIRGRYADAYPVNSSLFSSYGDWPVGGAPASAQCDRSRPNFTSQFCYAYPGVPVNAFVDAGVSYRFQLQGRNALFSINATNLLGNEVPTFVGTPNIGRMVVSRIQYTF